MHAADPRHPGRRRRDRPAHPTIFVSMARAARRLGGASTTRATLAALLAAALLLPVAPALAGAAPQQDQEVTLTLTGRKDRAITVAVPVFSIIPGAEGEASILHGVLVEDLHNSMVFDVVDAEYYPDVEMGDGPPDFTAWRQTGAEALIRGFVRRSGDSVIVEYRLYDVQSGGQVIGKRYPAQIPIAGANLSNTTLRSLAHQFNDEAVLYYTGIPGVADTQIAFVSDRRGAKEIYVMKADGYGEQRITNDGGLALNPAFSPSGDQIAYVSYRVHDGIPNVDIALLSRGGGIPPVVVRSPGQDTSPAFSPDGSRLAFSSTMDGISNGNAEIYVSRPDGRDVQRVTSNSAIDTSPTFSPNGRELIFISARAGGQHLYKMGVDGTNLERLRVEGTQIDSPAWNPNPQLSDLIAYAASEGGNRFQIFVYSLTTKQSVAVTRGYGRADSPSWSPDGRQIVFEASQGGATHIYVVGFDGTRLRQLTRDGNNQSPSWGGR